MTKLLAAFVAALALAACGGSSAKSATSTSTSTTAATNHTLSGKLFLGQDPGPDALGCTGVGGYSDISKGGSVTVKNESGIIVGSGVLDGGLPDSANHRCEFDFTVPNLEPAKFYSFTIGHRQPVTYSYDDLASKFWLLQLTLG